MRIWKAIVAGSFKESSDRIQVVNPYTGKQVAAVCRASAADIDAAIAKAAKAFERTKKLTSYERSIALEKVTDGIRRKREEFARTISLENGKPLKHCLAEVDRAINTFTIAAEEAKRIPGDYLAVDITPGTASKRAVVGRFPIGPVAGITPFNFPLNLVAHKIAPAMASGNPVLLKPASKTPVSALMLGELILDSGWPKDAISILPSHAKDAQKLVTDDRIKQFSFTGSADNGWKLKGIAGKKKVVLELGGNAAAVVDESADLARAVERCAWGGFYYSGQNCIHVQRIFCHEKIFDKFVKGFIDRVKKFRIGDPLKKDTDVSVLIDAKSRERVESWVDDALKKGAKLLFRGKAPKNVFPPTVLTKVPKACDVSCKEVFGPVVIIEKFRSYDEALRMVDDSDFGLQAGIFTDNINRAWQAFETLDVGGVMINEIPTFRVDNMPYGGIKDSGFGREGLKYAIEDMTELKIMIVHLP